jgi:hypothetical protein
MNPNLNRRQLLASLSALAGGSAFAGTSTQKAIATGSQRRMKPDCMELDR